MILGAHGRVQGVRIAVDNFGARFAPLNHLARLPIRCSEARSQADRLGDVEGRQAAVLESLVHLARRLACRLSLRALKRRSNWKH